MKNSDLFALYDGLVAVEKFGGARFAYGISKNKKIIKDEVDSLRESIKPSEKYTEFDTKRIELCKEMAKKDENNNPMLIGNNYDIENPKLFEKALNKLKDNYKEAIEEDEKKKKEFNDILMKEDCKLEFFKIKSDILPEEITSKQIDGIFELIEEV